MTAFTVLSSRRPRRSALVSVVVGVLSCLVLAGHPAQAVSSGFAPPPIRHVWIIELENKSYDAAFAKNTNTYLWKTLPSQGNLLRQYYGTGHNSLDNYLSELSGQAPNLDTQLDCQNYMDVTVGLPDPAAGDQVVGQGCVYGAGVQTFANQLQSTGLNWRGYMQDMGNDPTREQATCGQPLSKGQPVDPSGTGGSDGTQSAEASDQYAARHNPFIYFHAIIDDPASCHAHVVPLFHSAHAASSTDLAQDLRTVRTTPNFSFITPNLCDDAHDATCAGKNQAGSTQGGLFAADLFLKRVIPMIQASPAYRQDGMIVVTLDESGDVGTATGDTSCCGEPTGPNTPVPGLYGATASGGGRIGTIVLSKRYIKPGTVSDVPYNHYSLRRSLEDLFRIGPTASSPGSDGLGHLGYAGLSGLKPFGKDVYNITAAATPITTPGKGTGNGSAGAAGSGQATGSGRGLASTGLPLALPLGALLLLGLAARLRRRPA
jgi:hypothetical protein